METSMHNIMLHDAPLSVHFDSLFGANAVLFAIIIVIFSPKVFCILQHWIYPPTILQRNAIKLKVTEKCRSLWCAFLPFLVRIARGIFFSHACAPRTVSIFQTNRLSWGEHVSRKEVSLPNKMRTTITIHQGS